MEFHSRKKGASRNDRIAALAMRGMFVIAIIGLLIATSLRGQWEALLRTSDAGTFISDLPNAPIWQRPAVPDYKHFTKIFDGLPNEQPNASAISVVLRWDWVALELFLWYWLIGSVIGILYLIARGAYVDTLLHFVLYTAVGLTLGAFACVSLWLLFGGWGPPAPLFFAICGLIIGIVVGARRLQNVYPTPNTKGTYATEQSDASKSPVGREFKS